MYNVIIVEDDPMVAALNKQYLRSNPSPLTVSASFNNGQEAFTYLLKNKVDLIILDVYMPTLTGLELLQKIRQHNIPTEIIMVTAANSIEEVKQALNYGVLDYLVKPFDATRFHQALDKFHHKKEVLSQGKILNQTAIDIMSATPKPEEDRPLEKGLQPLTLEKIKTTISSYKDAEFTCKDISDHTELSAVTVQRYLSYLVNQKVLRTAIDYNTGGRPKMLYTKI